MKTVTNEFKEQIKKLGREIDFKIFLYANNKIITENNNFLMTEDNMNLVVQQFNEEEVEQTITSEDIFNVSIVNKGELLSTMMKEIDLEIRQELKISDVIDCQFGLKVGEEYEYVDYGKYMIYSKEYNEDTKSYNYVAFDRMLLTMQEASQDFLKNLEGKTLADCINIICNIVGLNYNATQEELETYPNLSKKINEGTFTDIQMTYRDVLDMISQALGLSMIVEGKELKLKKLAEIKNKEETIISKNNLYIEDATEGNALSYSVDGATEQQTYSGKNKFNKNNYNEIGSYYVDGTGKIVSGAYNYLTWIQLQANTTYTLSQPKTSNVTIRVGLFSEQPAAGVTGTVLGTFTGGTGITQTFTTTSTNVYLAWVYCNTNNLNGYTKQEMLDCIQIEEGSTATEYEPYVGGTPSPNPDYPQEVKTIPSIMNLFDKDNANVLNATINTSNRTITASSSNRTIYIPCKPNTTYTLYKKASPNSRVIGYSTTLPTTGTVLTYVSTISSNTTTKTITTGNDTQYLVVWVWNSGQDSETFDEMKDSLQLEKGSIFHEYVPYGYWSKVKITGKNLIKVDSVYGTVNNVTSVLNNDNSITFTGIPSNATANISTWKNQSIPIGTYTFSIDHSISTANVRIRLECNDGTYLEPTITKGNLSARAIATKPIVRWRIWISGLDTTVNLNETLFFQLEQGETATEYESYKENVVLIDMSKENLFDKDNVMEGYRIDSNGLPYATTGYNLSDFIPVKPNTNYYRNKTITTNNALAFYDSSKTFIERKTSGNLVTTTADTYYIRTDINDNDLPTTTLFEGNNPTPYYELCEIGDYKDTLSIDSSGNVVVNKGIGKVVLNGSESWTYQITNGYRTDISNIKQTTSGGENSYVISNYYQTEKQQNLSNVDYGISNRANQSQIIIKNKDCADSTALKTWLSTHNTDVYYVLATPETINLPNTKIPLFDGINHVTFVDNLETDTSITYTSQELANMEEINEQYLKDTNVSFGEKYMINSVVLSRSEDTDTIYRRDEESIAKNGVHEFKIKDNLIMLYDDREDYIDEIFEQLNGLEYYVNDFSSTGITYLDWLDFYNVKVGNKAYKCLMLNDEIKINQGLEETIYTEEPEETVTDYKTSSKTDKEVSFIVDKQNGKIRGQVSKDDIIASLNVAIENGQGIVELKGNSVVIESDNFTLDEEGNAKMSSVEINHGKMKLYDESSEGTEIWPEFSIESGDGTYYNDSENKIWSNLIQIISKYQGNTLAALGLRRGSPYMLLEELNFITSLLAGEILLRNDTTNATTQILPGMIIINDGQGHSKTITPTN